ncbi:MAG: hypothetical protein KGI38_12645 [Thaumarchaeota archaeon]|nr:hypothetical protein [Nitrososphaerota archaeon]
MNSQDSGISRRRRAQYSGFSQPVQRAARTSFGIQHNTHGRGSSTSRAESGDEQRASTPALTVARPECVVAASRPQFILARGRRFCATCQIRKTRWVVEYGTVSYYPNIRKGATIKDHGYRNRRCWKCMTDEERAALMEGY